MRLCIAQAHGKIYPTYKQSITMI